MPDTAWDDFVQAHGQIIGYTTDEWFVPVPPGDARAIRIREQVAAEFGRDPGTPVYGPTCHDRA